MPASADDLQKSIQPGSVPSGERDDLEAGLAQAVGGGAGAAPTAPPGGASSFPSMSSPLGAMLSGEVKQDGLPLTDGLSNGPGAGPSRGNPVMQSPEAVKLRSLAEHSKTPLVRALALRRLMAMNLAGKRASGA